MRIEHRVKEAAALVILLFIIYALSAMSSSYVHMDFSETEWGNAWTWFWFILWALVLGSAER